ncbi:Smr family protein [Bartonella australis AUST/NH1]|uniref:Smr family protein n=1 Tax=Bartonella australis (strain Aust/NH1) TaxID=1094489 RepID=M1PBJ8_BARAA|nr:Smr/MutS family protein [Bartonella australis]AGF74001.1 Smr family protein [Bartonella australis AUST/NH1]
MFGDKWEKKQSPLVLGDRLLWEMVCRTTLPLRGKLRSSVREDTESSKNEKLKRTKVHSFSQKHQQKPMMVKEENRVLAQTDKIYSFDHTAHRKLAKGRYPIEARLDLHGLIQEKAYFSLKKFLQSSQQRGLRYVLVITGKGRSHGSDGVLCRLVPHWLSTPIFRCYVYAFEQAAQRHGGNGALYIQLQHLI